MVRWDASHALKIIRPPPNDLLWSFRKHLLKLVKSQKHTDTIMKLFLDLKSISNLMEEVPPDDIETMDEIVFSDQVEDVERRSVLLLQLDKYHLPVESWRASLYVKALAYAALIHIYVVPHELPHNLNLMNVLSERLRVTLEKLDFEDFKVLLPTMLLWVLLMGGIGAVEAETQHWYGLRMAAICQGLGLYTDESVQHHLTHFLWSERYYNFQAFGVWVELAMAR